jgi:hypothetical protein
VQKTAAADVSRPPFVFGVSVFCGRLERADAIRRSIRGQAGDEVFAHDAGAGGDVHQKA